MQLVTHKVTVTYKSLSVSLHQIISVTEWAPPIKCWRCCSF